MFAQQLALRIKELRKERGFTQENLAKKASMSRSELAEIETAKRNVSAAILCKIIGGLEMTVRGFYDSELFDYEPHNSPQEVTYRKKAAE